MQFWQQSHRTSGALAAVDGRQMDMACQENIAPHALSFGRTLREFQHEKKILKGFTGNYE